MHNRKPFFLQKIVAYILVIIIIVAVVVNLVNWLFDL